MLKIRVKWWDGGMPGGHWRGWAGKLISEEIWNPDLNDRKESSIDHDNADGNMRCFTFLEVLIFSDLPQYQGSLNQHVCIKIAASESFCTMCYFVVKNTCLLISLINAHFTSRFSRLSLVILEHISDSLLLHPVVVFLPVTFVWEPIVLHVNSASHGSLFWRLVCLILFCMFQAAAAAAAAAAGGPTSTAFAPTWSTHHKFQSGWQWHRYTSSCTSRSSPPHYLTHWLCVILALQAVLFLSLIVSNFWMNL